MGEEEAESAENFQYLLVACSWSNRNPGYLRKNASDDLIEALESEFVALHHIQNSRQVSNVRGQVGAVLNWVFANIEALYLEHVDPRAKAREQLLANLTRTIVKTDRI